MDFDYKIWLTFFPQDLQGGLVEQSVIEQNEGVSLESREKVNWTVWTIQYEIMRGCQEKLKRSK